MLHHGLLTLAISLLFTSAVFAIPWNSTEFLFVFGDSYSADGYNVSSGVNSSTPGWTSSNGPNWVEYLVNTYNQTAVKPFDLAFGGATIDSALVPPYLPTVQSIVDQVSEFSTYLASKPAGAQWGSTNSLFSTFIGINDVGNSAGWDNITRCDFYGILMDRLFSQMEILYDAGARNFLFLTVPPTNRAPLQLEQGPQVAAVFGSYIDTFNEQLAQSASKFQADHPDLGSVTIYDTQPVFNTLLDSAPTFGFVNVTGFCSAYEQGTPTSTYQVEGCAPVSDYFWLNSLHPMYTVHNILAKAISTVLAGY